MLYLGIDPGFGGGLACIDSDRRVVLATGMPETERDILDAINACTLGKEIAVRAAIERVWSSPQMGVASSFKFGTSVGMLRMALTASRIPFDEVLPTKWQQALGCRVGKSRAAGGTGGDKNITKRRAQQLYPDTKVTHAIADALLIAEFCRLTAGGGKVTPIPAQQEMFSNGEEEDSGYTHPARSIIEETRREEA